MIFLRLPQQGSFFVKMIKLNRHNPLELFGIKIFNLLVENFPRTFFVGGCVRDKILKRKIQDIDIATEAQPKQVKELLHKAGIICDASGENFGSVRALYKVHSVEITSFRQESYHQNRYPKITYVNNIKSDAKRRDFTINALYFNPKLSQILDFFKGIEDLKKKRLKFIGRPEQKIKQDPLRILRGLRFCLELGFKMSNRDWQAVIKNFKLIKHVTKNKSRTEVLKLSGIRRRKLLEEIILGEKSLDKLSQTFYDDFK